METSPYEDEHVLQMRALQAERNGDAEGAREILENLTDSRNQSLRNWARFRLGSISLNGNVESPENLKMLTQSLPLWRGHPNERAMLDALARRYRNAGEPRAALSIWNKLIELYPEARSDETITGARQATFVNAVTESKSIPLDPFEVYSIYLDFIDLLPDESDNRKIYRDLAQHLAKLDLLGEAAQMLQPLIERLDDPIERAEIGAKIARLFLDQDRADSALSILARTNPRTTSLPASLHQERQLTSAETLAELGRTEEALEQIKDLQTFPARRLRAKLAWAEQSWPRLINAVETVLADPKLPDPLSVTDQRLVLWLAIAQGQRGEKRELQDLRRQYADLMRSGPWGEAFAVATQFAEGANDVISALSDTEAQLAELRRFRETVKANP